MTNTYNFGLMRWSNLSLHTRTSRNCLKGTITVIIIIVIKIIIVIISKNMPG